MFDVYEAVDELIEEINTDYYESCYDAIYEELCDRVDYGELTIEEAEMINDVAAYKYLYEAEDVDKALEEDDDDDKKKKKSDRNIKKKINKKKIAAGVGLAAAGAGALSYAKRKYKDDADNSLSKFSNEEIDRSVYHPRKDYYKDGRVSPSSHRKFQKAVKNQKDIYKKANKLGKKKILNDKIAERDYRRKEREKKS